MKEYLYNLLKHYENEELELPNNAKVNNFGYWFSLGYLYTRYQFKKNKKVLFYINYDEDSVIKSVMITVVYNKPTSLTIDIEDFSENIFKELLGIIEKRPLNQIKENLLYLEKKIKVNQMKNQINEDF